MTFDFWVSRFLFTKLKQTPASAPSTNLGGHTWGQASMTLATGVHLLWGQESGKTVMPLFFP